MHTNIYIYTLGEMYLKFSFLFLNRLPSEGGPNRFKNRYPELGFS